MRISRRARLIRKLLGSVVLDPEEPIEKRRDSMERLDKLPRPRRVDYVDTEVAGVPAIVATPTAVPVERHILYLHGGGYELGSPRSHIALCARLGRLAHASVTVIDYRLAPEHPYPAAIEDCTAAARAIMESVDPSLVTVAGDSAGGGAALATLCALRDGGDPMPGCAYLISPWTDLTGSGESRRTRADVDPIIDADWLGVAGVNYAGGRPLDDPGLSPLFAELAGLPPMLVQAGDDEVLLSDSTRLVERARAAGVDVDLDVRAGMWHVYQMTAPIMPESTRALVEAAAYIRTKTPAPDLLEV